MHCPLFSTLFGSRATQAAAERVRGALARGVEDSDLLWDLWFRLRLVELGASASEALAELPDLTDATDDTGRGMELESALESLVTAGAVRINCGGQEFVDRQERVWLADRFFTAGYRYFGDRYGSVKRPFDDDIRGTDDDPLYQTERWFGASSSRPPGYAVPLPPGRYRVVLHFAEIFCGLPGVRCKRVFDVLAEDGTVLESCEPGKDGFATACREAFEVDVSDGWLDIVLERRLSDPKISAIEIDRLGR